VLPPITKENIPEKLSVPLLHVGHQFRYENRETDGSVYGCYGYNLPGQRWASETLYMAGAGMGYRVIEKQVARVYQRVNAAKFPIACIK
jgi:hypothetical protein